MKRFLYFISVVFFFFIPVKSIGQLNHFIYLQSENKQPFYVKMNKTIYNSTVSGYLIIPKLQDGTYNFHLGFVSNTQNKEYEFSCSISNKDMGYLVKNFSDARASTSEEKPITKCSHDRCVHFPDDTSIISGFMEPKTPPFRHEKSVAGVLDFAGRQWSM